MINLHMGQNFSNQVLSISSHYYINYTTFV